MSDIPIPAPSVETEKLPPLTLLIEWENAQDAAEQWVRNAVVGLQDELQRNHNNFDQLPTVLYLFDNKAVSQADIESFIARCAPRLPELCTLKFVPTDGLTYYNLKNYGSGLVGTDIMVLLDSDTAPQPGWLRELVTPLLKDPDLMAVGGTTVLGFNNLVSRTMALSWNFPLRSERRAISRSRHIHANNLAVRTEFFRSNPFPKLPTFRKQCTFWIRDVRQRGIKWARALDAVTIHAPQRDVPYLAWRAWRAGLDYDMQLGLIHGPGRFQRLGRATTLWLKKTGRTSWRILTKHAEVGMPWWQIPGALVLGDGYYLIHYLAQIWSVIAHSQAELASYRPATQH